MPTPIDNLSIIVSANTGPLAQDMAKAGRILDDFNRKAERAPRVRDAQGLPVLRETPGRSFSVASELAKANTAKARAAYQPLVEREAIARAKAERSALYQRQLANLADGRSRDATHYRRMDLTDLSKFGLPGVVRRGAGWVGGHVAAGAGAVGRTAGAGFERLAGMAESAGSSLLGFAKTVPAVAAGIVAAEVGVSGLAAAFQHLKQAVMLAGELEQTHLAFSVMMDDSAAAGEHIADLRKYAASTPFNVREITDSSRQLIAYGRSADQAITDIRMLGDVSAAFGKRLPIGDLTYLYGTLYAQQRAYTRDLFQFSNRGIPIYRELGKVLGKSGAELQAFVEDGRVGFEHVRQAFINMTAAGGQFNGMTERQGKTFLGVWERMTDGAEISLTKFGQVLIEELDLHGATRDLEAFFGRLEHGSERLRGGINLMGKLGRAAIQVGYEFTRASIDVAALTFKNFSDHLPGMREAGKLVHEMLVDIAGFKIDDRTIIRTAFTFGKAMADVWVDWGNKIGMFGEGLAATVDMIARGAHEAKDSIRLAAEWLNSINNSLVTKILRDPIMAPVRAIQEGIERPPLTDRADRAQLHQPWNMQPPIPGMSPDRIRREYRSLTEYLEGQEALLAHHRQELAAGRGNDFTVQLFERKVGEAHRFRANYETGFESPGNGRTAGEALRAGDVPAIRMGSGGPAPYEGILKDVRSVFAQFRGWDASAFKDRLSRAEIEALAADDAKRTAEELAAFRDRTMHDALGATLGPAAAIQSPPDRAANRAAAWGGALGSLGAFRGGMPPIPPDVQSTALELRRQFDPMPELKAYREQLDQIRDRGLLGNDSRAMTAVAWTRKLHEVGEQFGLSRTTALPSAVETGSAEDARLVNVWRTQGTGAQTAEGLLQQLVELTRQQLQTQRGMSREQAPPPRPVVRLPGD